MKRVIECIVLCVLMILAIPARADLPTSYPINIDPCIYAPAPSLHHYCKKPEFFRWSYAVANTNVTPTMYTRFFDENFSTVVQYVLEKAQNQGCPNCIVIDENIYNTVKNHNQAVLAQPLDVLYYRSSSISPYYVTSQNPYYTEYGVDDTFRYIVIGTVEQSVPGINFSGHSNIINPSAYQVINVWGDTDNSFGEGGGSGSSPSRGTASLASDCRFSAGGSDAIYYPWGLGRRNPGSTKIYWCLEDSASDTRGASDLDTLKEGCAYGCNPVNLATGDKIDYHVDYQNSSPFPIVIDRWYLSSDQKNAWSFSHQRSLRHAGALGGYEHVLLYRPDGSHLTFTRSSPSSPWTTLPGASHVLGKFETVNISPEKYFAYKNLHSQTEFYNQEGVLTIVENLSGNRHVYTYSGSDLVKIEDDFGRFVNLTYSGTGRSRHISSLTDGDMTVSFDVEYKTFRNGEHVLYKNLLKEVTYDDGKSIQYHYDELVENPKGLLTGITKEDDERFATYVYDTNGKVLQTSHGFGKNVNQYHFDEMGSSILWGGGDAYFPKAGSFTQFNKTAGSTNLCPNCGGHQASNVSYHYSSGAVSSSTSHDGVTTSNAFYYGGTGDLGLPDTTTKYAGTSQEQNTSYTWNGTTRQPLSMIEDIVVEGVNHTRTTLFTYDTSNRLTQMVVSTSTGEPSRSYSFTYNTKNQVLTKTTPLGTTTYTYDLVNGNKLTETNALGHQTVFSNYTPRGLLGKTVDPNGLETIYSYDNRDRLTEVKRGKASLHWETISMEYTDYGALEKVTYPDLTTVEYVYDDAHRLSGMITPQGKMVLTLNTDGDPISEQIFDKNNNLVHEQHKMYDFHRNVQANINADYQATFMYYTAGKLSYISDPDYDFSHQMAKVFDDQGRLFIVGDARRNVVMYNYDKNDNITKISDGNFVETLFSYNGFGQNTSINSPDAGLRTFEYHSSGLVSSQKDAKNVETVYSHDVLGRTTQMVFDGSMATPFLPNITQTFVYDSCINGVGKLCEVQDQSGTTAYSYDLWGRVTSKVVTLSQPSSVVLVNNYTYNNKGQLVSLAYPSGKRLDYTYTDGLVSSIEYDFQTVVDNITYSPLSQTPLSWDWSTGSVSIDTDLNGRIESITDTDQRDYLYNAKGWLLGITDPLDTSKDQLFTYNASKNLTQANFAVRPDPIDYTFDENANILERTVGPLPVDISWYDFWTNYGINNRPDYIWEHGSSYAETYDDNGNIVNNGKGLTVTYNVTNRLVSSSRLGVNATYSYNFEGLRQRKSGPHLSTGHLLYAYDEHRRLLGVYDGAGVALEEYIYLDGFRVIGMARNISSVSSIPHLYSVLTDHLGTPRKVLDNTGSAVWSWETKDPYGHSAPDSLLSGSHFEFNLRFPGQTFDSETGLYHNGFRDYDPNRGRYIQPDPIGLQGGLNLYAYAESDPVNGYDPLGLDVVVHSSISTQVNNALGVLEASSTASDLIQRLKDSDHIYKITYGKESFYDPNTRTVYWNPNQDGRCLVTWNRTPSEIILFHELAHASNHELGKIPYKSSNWLDNLSTWHNEESSALNQEVRVSKELMLPYRKSYILSSPISKKGD